MAQVIMSLRLYASGLKQSVSHEACVCVCVLTFSLLVVGFAPGEGFGLLQINLGCEIKDGNRQAFNYCQALSVKWETRESTCTSVC